MKVSVAAAAANLRMTVKPGAAVIIFFIIIFFKSSRDKDNKMNLVVLKRR